MSTPHLLFRTHALDNFSWEARDCWTIRSEPLKGESIKYIWTKRIVGTTMMFSSGDSLQKKKGQGSVDMKLDFLQVP
jgi:hypothetical protein